MDAELIIYLVFLAIALLGRLLGKKKKQQSAPTQNSKPSRPQKSFQELLEEFTNPEATQEPFNDPIEVERPEPRRSRRTAPVEEREPTSEELYQFQSERELRTLDELVDIDRTRTKTKLAAVVEEEEEEESQDILEMFNSPEDARRAVILSEILQRKYS